MKQTRTVLLAHQEVSTEEAIFILQWQGYLVTAPPTA